MGGGADGTVCMVAISDKVTFPDARGKRKMQITLRSEPSRIRYYCGLCEGLRKPLAHVQSTVDVEGVSGDVPRAFGG